MWFEQHSSFLVIFNFTYHMFNYTEKIPVHPGPVCLLCEYLEYEVEIFCNLILKSFCFLLFSCCDAGLKQNTQ